MTTSTLQTEEYSQSEAQLFCRWLKDSGPDLERALATLQPSIPEQWWLNLLQQALDPTQDLSHILQSVPVTLAMLTQLFEVTLEALPLQDPSIVKPFLRIQNRVLVAAAGLQQSKLSQTLLDASQQLSKKLLTNTSPNQLLQEAVSLVCRLFDYPSLNLFLVSKTQKLRLQTAIWQNHQPSSTEMIAFTRAVNQPDSVVRRTIGSGEVAWRNQPPYTLPADQTPIQSEMAIPLLAGDRIIAVLHTFSHSNATFEPDKLFVLQSMANQLVLAIENAELQNTNQRRMQEIQERLAEVSTFYIFSQQIASTLDLDKLLNNLARSLRQAVDCRACAIFLLNKAEAMLEIKAADGLKPHWRKAARLAVGQGAAGQAVAQQQTVYIPDTAEDPNFIFFDRAVRSIIVMPMIYHGKVIGAINLDDSQPHAFGKTQERLLSIAASQAAIAIDNATLFRHVTSEEQRTRIIIQHMADGLLMVGSTGRIERVNATLSDMIGLPAKEIIGQNIHADHLDPRLAAICAPATVKARTGVLASEVTIPGPQPSVLRVYATPITDDNGQAVGEVRVVHDITKDRELAQMKDELMATVSHELRTPLFSIQGFANILLSDNPPPPETQREFLEIIQRQANQLATLVTRQLDTDKISAGALEFDKQPLQIADVISQTLGKLEGFARQSGVELESQMPAHLPELEGDAPRLEQVLTNLVGNAIKFTPEGGTVTVSARRDTDHLTLIIKDTGIGIPEADLPRIFSKFYQVKKVRPANKPGSGLGLHIARQIIESHDGKIWAESTVNQGSTFFVQLPLPEAA